MVSPILLRPSVRSDLYVCARCTLRASKGTGETSRRWIGQKFLAKQAEAERAWQEQSKEIKAGKKKSMLSILEERGLVHQIAGGRDKLDQLMTDKRVGAYVGIDPSASSLHVGHLLPLMSIFWMYVHGFHAVSILGGATAKIGDPTDRLKSREKQHRHVHTANMVAMHYQLKKLWQNVEAYGRKHGYNWEWAWHRELVNNNTWLNKLGIMEVLQTLGPGMRLGTMLGRDTVKNKMENGDGMSFAEFSYPLLQSWDWWHMYQTKGIQLQIGGSDQYGNIIAGIDAIKYIGTHHPDPDVRKDKDTPLMEPMGFTVPLLTTSAGAKFGKSAGNAVWLDKAQTSSFDLYGFFVRQSDADVGRYLRLFTFLPIGTIEAVLKEHEADPKLRKAQHLLAREFVELVHGVEEAKDAEMRHRLLHAKVSGFVVDDLLKQGDGEGQRKESSIVTLNNAPIANIKLPSSLIYTKSIGRILCAAGLAASAADGHRTISSGGVYIGGTPSQKKPMPGAELKFTPIKNWVIEDTAKFLVEGRLLVLRKGKHNIRVVEVVDDEEWKASGLRYPGEHVGPSEEEQLEGARSGQ